MSVEENIRKKMSEKGITQADLADAIGVSRPAISITLKRNMRIDTLLKIANVLDVAPGELLGENSQAQTDHVSVKCPHCGAEITLSICAE